MRYGELYEAGRGRTRCAALDILDDQGRVLATFTGPTSGYEVQARAVSFVEAGGDCVAAGREAHADDVQGRGEAGQNLREMI